MTSKIGVAPNRETHVPPIGELQPVGSERPVHPAESRTSLVPATMDRT